MIIKISRSMTVNTGNFSSVKPSVEVSVDVPAADTDKAYHYLGKVADSLMALEFSNLTEEMEAINNVGWANYRELLEEKRGHIMESLIESADKLVELEM